MWSCLRRHKNKLFFLGGVVGGVVLFNSYLKRKFIEWETQKTDEMCDQLKRYRHFDSTMVSCDNVFLSFAPKIRMVVCKTVDVNLVVQQVGTNPPNKIQLWEELKVLVFTQALGEMYAQCMLCILLRVQMSILSGYLFVSRCTNQDATEQQQKYLYRIEDFILNGINKLLSIIKTSVEDVIKSFPLHKPIKLQDVEYIIKSIQANVFKGNKNILLDIFYLMPAGSSSAVTDKFFENVSLETRDIIECNDFDKVLNASIDSGVSSIMDRLSECYVILSDGKEDFVNPHDFVTPLAKLIPIMHNVFCQHKPDEQGSLVHTLLQLDTLNNFAANIYEAFSQKSC